MLIHAIKIFTTDTCVHFYQVRWWYHSEHFHKGYSGGIGPKKLSNPAFFLLFAFGIFTSGKPKRLHPSSPRPWNGKRSTVWDSGSRESLSHPCARWALGFRH